MDIQLVIFLIRGCWKLNRILNNAKKSPVAEKKIKKLVRNSEIRSWFYWGQKTNLSRHRSAAHEGLHL